MAKAAEMQPDNRWSERLEIVRKLQTEISSFALFVKRARRRPDEFPLATARTWHTNRHPSLDYLEAVVFEYGVSGHWLLIGEGEPFEPGVIEGYIESGHEPISDAALDMERGLSEVIVDRGHTWFFGHTWMIFSVPEFIEDHFQAREEEPTLERAVAVMDAHFPMLREGAKVPVDDRGKLVAGMHSALATAWLQVED